MDTNNLQDYIGTLTDTEKQFVESQIIEYDFDIGKLLKEYVKWLDCSRISKDGMRLMTTIGIPYRYTLSQVNYLIENHCSEEARPLMWEQFIKLHNSNLEFEKLNPPPIYKKVTKKVTKKSTNKKSKLKQELKTSNFTLLEQTLKNVKIKLKLKPKSL